jgi:uncharacterized protein YprB with RNaseH-like and TPR domain
MSLKHKLQRMKGHLSKETGKPAGNISGDVPYHKRWEELQAKPFAYEQEYVMVREVRYPLTHLHGKYRFGELREILTAWNESGMPHPLSGSGKQAEDFLFFDTETTGLHGGAGNTIFLLGYSRYQGDHVEVRQHFLPAPHAEVALFQSFLPEIHESTHLVTFNGKAFDWPQVKTRHTLVRHNVPRLPACSHYDLLHGARRLWKEELPSCRLSIIEHVKLGVRRTGDVPGYMAPQLYFDYLQCKDPDKIRGVLEHNEIDVLSLITLYIHLSKLLITHESVAHTMEELFAVARWYESLGADEQALIRYQTIMEIGRDRKAEAMIALGHLYKRRKDWQQSLSMWESFMAEYSYVPEEVYLEAAKICEHHLKDYKKALHYSMRAYDVWNRKGSMLRYKSKRERDAYVKRIERLENRVQSGK